MNQALPDEARIDVVELRIPCKAEWVALARLSVAAVASRLHFSIDEIEDIKLAVAEACTNAIQHAHGSPSIEIRCEADGDGLRIHVADFGRAGRMDSVRPADEEVDRVGGLGIFLIRSLMDEVTYDAGQDEGGTRLVMSKKLLS